jgi:prepilin-type N-terminal cleavage/methylation domain-containing protein/prepilin-type processing-associated H-X9-DG protein
MRRTRRTAGFTIIELLVVVAIIAILAGLIFPVFTKARDKAREGACQSNLKQIGIALRMYLGDHDGKLLTAAVNGGTYIHDATTVEAMRRLEQTANASLWNWGWPTLLFPYTKNYAICFCPSDGSAPTLTQVYTFPPGVTPSYFYRHAIDYSALWGRTEGDSCRPTDQYAFFERFDWHHNKIGLWSPAANVKMNVCFLDGHVKAFQARETTYGSGMFDPYWFNTVHSWDIMYGWDTSG